MDELGGAARRRGRHGGGGAVALGGLRARFAGRLLHGAEKTKKMVANTETVGSGADRHGQLMIGSVNRSGSSTRSRRRFSQNSGGVCWQNSAPVER